MMMTNNGGDDGDQLTVGNRLQDHIQGRNVYANVCGFYPLKDIPQSNSLVLNL